MSTLNSQIPIIRCPSCGGVNLQAGYDQSYDLVEKQKIKAWRWGLIGFAINSLTQKRPTTTGKYWVCRTCGKTFPMN